ncbi:MAG: T9SS type A sorting domain-containing protein [Candidatus Cloacimonetes bacterium]|nr:T9SS type A sorting domain-containing protein [Candidatus Cloacimonadota bacterium]
MKKSLLALLFLTALTLSAEVLWEHTYLVGPGWADEIEVNSVSQCEDGGFLIGGYWRTGEPEMERCGFVVRTNADGLQQWVDWDSLQSYYPANHKTQCLNVFEMPDGSVMSVGGYGRFSSPDGYYLIQRDSNGNRIWVEECEDDDIYPKDVIPCSDGNILLSGHTNSFPTLIKLNQNGDIIWENTYLSGSIQGGTFLSVIETSDGDLVATGYGNVFVTISNTLLVHKISSEGDSLWSHTHPDSTRHTQGLGLCENNDNNLFVVGWASQYPPPPSSAGYAALFTPDGDRVWHHSAELDTLVSELGFVINIPFTSKFLVSTGRNSANDKVYQTDYDYNIEWQRNDLPFMFCLAGDQNIVFASSYYTWGITLMLTDLDLAPVGDEDIPPPERYLQAYPNPFNPSTTIEFNMMESGQTTLCVYNIKGQHVATLLDEPLQAGNHTVTWEVSDLANGVYFARLTINNQQISLTKLCLIK